MTQSRVIQYSWERLLFSYLVLAFFGIIFTFLATLFSKMMCLNAGRVLHNRFLSLDL